MLLSIICACVLGFGMIGRGAAAFSGKPDPKLFLWSMGEFLTLALLIYSFIGK